MLSIGRSRDQLLPGDPLLAVRAEVPDETTARSHRLTGGHTFANGEARELACLFRLRVRGP